MCDQLPNDELMVRAKILNALGIQLPDPHLYNVCALEPDTFESLVSAIIDVRTKRFWDGWEESKGIALKFERAKIVA